MKQKLLSISTVIAFTAISLSCKKGENDPFLSLKSRDSRITGIWELTNLDYTETDTYSYDGTTVTTTSTETYDGSLLTMVSDGDVDTYSYTYTLTIEKDGTYNVYIILDGYRNEKTGNWWWLDDKKRKTRIAFDDDLGSFEIDRLTNKELILKDDYYSSEIDSDGDLDELTRSRTLTFEKTK